MNLHTQVNLITFSFFFGIVFSIFLTVNYKLIYNSNKFIKIISSFLVILISSLIYFICKKKINNAILHYYSFLFIICGFIIEHFIEMLIEKHKKR